MADKIIVMDDMMAVYDVTDLFGIDRETISVPLGKEGSGSVIGGPGGDVEITVPVTMPTAALAHLHWQIDSWQQLADTDSATLGDFWIPRELD